MFRRITLATLILMPAMALLGCCSPCSTGWNFSVGKPPTISGQTVLGPQVTSFAGQGLASTMVVNSHALAAQAGELSPVMPLPMPRAAVPLASAQGASGCTLDEVCALLRGMRTQLDKLSAGKPMPTGQEE